MAMDKDQICMRHIKVTLYINTVPIIAWISCSFRTSLPLLFVVDSAVSVSSSITLFMVIPHQ
jgi:hypothetical protein